MRVEIWTDVICPWCGIGEHRLKQALAKFEHASEVEVVHRAYQLDERAPVGETQTARAMLAKKGLAAAQVDAMVKRVESIAAADGLSPYRVAENLVGNTSLAHELAKWAAAQGREPEVWAALYRAYFGEGRSIFDVDALVALAGEVGLDGAKAREALEARTYARAVAADGREARELGANGVPFFVVDRKRGVQGAQPVETLLEVLRQGWADGASRPSTRGEGCEDEACAAPEVKA